MEKVKNKQKKNTAEGGGGEMALIDCHHGAVSQVHFAVEIKSATTGTQLVCAMWNIICVLKEKVNLIVIFLRGGWIIWFTFPQLSITQVNLIEYYC